MENKFECLEKHHGIEPLLTPPDVIRILAISPCTFYHLVGSGNLPATKVGGQWRIGPSVLKEFIARPPRRRGRRLKIVGDYT